MEQNARPAAAAGITYQRPLMDSMLSLLPQDEPAGSLFLGLCLRRLPQDMRDHLSTRQFDTPHQMAETADLLWEAAATHRSPRPGRRRLS